MSSQTSAIRRTEVVETVSGKVRGSLQGEINVFKGIPYGASTAGAGRFRPPRKPEAWSGIREALGYGARAPQPPFNAPPGPLSEIVATSDEQSEDCLCLNVWSPGVDGAKRPVMVWLHGGAFSFGSGGAPVYEGTELAAGSDVVVVTVNHRLNLFGYLYLAELGGEEYRDSGNAGMLDLIAALEWVRDNIAGFGGDPGNVTIFGESGGGSKVSILMAMPAARGLFHRAISQSGPHHWLPRERAAALAARILSDLGLEPNQVDELRNLPVDRLLGALSAIPGGLLNAVAPVIDGRSVPADPLDPSALALSASVPLLIGTNATEMTLMGPPITAMDDATLLAQTTGRLKIGEAAAERLVAVYRNAHGDNMEAWCALDSDRFVRIDAIRQAERKAALEGAPVYMYYFTWRTPVLGGYLRAAHALEIPFVFDHVDVWPGFTGEGQDRYSLAAKMSGAWGEFARTGKPSDADLPEWPPYTTGRRATMIFDNECKVVDDPGGEERRAFEAGGAAAGVV
jgi:para-nitrobenzyl esterase